jgi:hypothetical protein
LHILGNLKSVVRIISIWYTIISRIENDPIRDESVQAQQKAKVRWQLEFLENAYPNAVRINTEGRNLNGIIGKIKNLLQYEKELTF